MTKKEAAAQVDVSSFLQANATKTPTKSKKHAIPVVEGHGQLADKCREAYTTMKDAEATFKAIEEEVLTKVSPEYEACALRGEFTKTFNVEGTTTSGVQISWKDSFTAIKIEEKPTLQEELGDRFDTYFEEKREVSLADTSDAAIQSLIAKLGPDDFQKYFSVKLSLIAKADMDRKQFDLPTSVRNRVNQYKPALKIVK
jgi:hypothetical protein